jgi:hypothetical protein
MAKITIDIIAKDSASKALNAVNKNLGGVGTAAQKTTTSLAAMAKGWLTSGAAFGAVSAAFGAYVKFMSDAGATAGRFAEINSKQAAILNATGQAAGFSASQLDSMARSLSKSTELQVSAVKEAQSLLLTFRNISGDAFPRAMQAAADLQTTFGSLESSTMQLGKALNDPIQGITALNRAGVTFTQAQKDMIRYFVETNQVAKAQAIILQEVENQVGGTAAAVAEAGDGSGRLRASLELLSAELGRNVLPAQQAWNNALANTVDWLEETNRKTRESTEAARRLATSSEQVSRAMYIASRQGGAYAGSIERLILQQQRGALMTEFYKNMLAGTVPPTMQAADATEELAQETSKANQEYLKLVDTMSADYAGMNEKAAEIANQRAALEAQLTAKLKAGYSEQGKAVQEIKGKLAELGAAEQKLADDTELAGRRRMLSMIEQKLASDELTEGEMQALENLGIKWGVYSEEGVEAARAVRKEVERIATGLNNIPTGKSIDVVLNALMTVATGTSFQTLGGATSSGVEIFARAAGGPVSAGSPYVVGEQGAELFVPNTSGQIIPNHALGGNSVTINVSGASDPQTVAREIMRQLKAQGVA